MSQLVLRNGYQLLFYAALVAALVGGLGAEWKVEVMLRVANGIMAAGAGAACTRAYYSARNGHLSAYPFVVIFALVTLVFAFFVYDVRQTVEAYDYIGSLIDALS